MSDRFDIHEARKARDARNHELNRLEEGTLELVEALREPPVALKKTDLYLVLLACHGLGREGARTVCERSHVWPHTHLGDLTKRERADLIRELPKRVKGSN